MGLEAGDPAPDSPARLLLRRQAEVLDLQKLQLHEQIGLNRNERFRNRIKAVRDGALAALTLGVAAGLAWMVWDASRAEGVVIEPLLVSPALAQEGLTGEAAARRILSRVAAMQKATPSSRAGRSSREETDELAVEIPQTGVSAGEVMRLLRRRLGEETVVTGELAAGGLSGPSLSLMADGELLALPESPAERADASGPPLDRLLDRAAEAVFLRTDPYRYAVWLGGVGRVEEQVALLERQSIMGPPAERAWAYSGLSARARADGRLADAVRLAREAARLDPELRNVFGNLGSAENDQGHDEAALQAFLRAGEPAPTSSMIDRATQLRAKFYSDSLLEDPQASLVTAGRMTGVADTLGLAEEAIRLRAHAMAAMHDLAGARGAVSGYVTQYPPGTLRAKGLDILAARTLRDWPQLERSLRSPTIFLGPYPDQLRRTWERVYPQPYLAEAVARQGRFAEADALVAATPLDCYACVRARGRIAAARGDRAAADRWFAEAVRQGPSLPQAHAEWGQAKLAARDLRGAIATLREAQKRGPGWADPLRYEGDALALQGKHRAAVRRFDAALERAPRWGAAHLAAGRSLQALRKPERAADAYRRALRLDLSAADRAEASRRLATLAE